MMVETSGESTATAQLLQGIQVLDLSDNLAGVYAARLLIDCGATVLRPRGVPVRLGDPGTDRDPLVDKALLEILTRGGIETSPGAVGSHLARVDLVLESDGWLGLDREALRAERPDVVLVSVTDFGLRGPWGRARAGTALRQAISGSTYWRGMPEAPPVMAGGEVEQFLGAAYAASAGLAAVRQARATGVGDHLDVSLAEAANLGLTTFGATHASLSGQLGTPFPARSIQVPAIERTSDGWVGLCAISARQRQDLMLIMGRGDLAEDESIAYSGADTPNADAMRAAIQEWAVSMPTEAVAELASAIRVPVAPIGTGATLTDNEQLAHRGFYESSDELPGMGPAFHFAASPGAALGHSAAARPRVEQPETGKPLAGLRVVDLTAWWAGPAATQLLATFGADVIKVESGVRPDGMRYSFVDDPSRDQWWEFGPVFYGVNTNKRGISLDLRSPGGREVLTRLLLEADLLVENFTPRVLDGLGIDWDHVTQENPGLMTVRMAAFGHDGPWRDRSGFAQTIEQASGLAWVTGHADGPPVSPRGVCDPLAGIHAAFAALAAVAHRDRTGRGGVVTMSMLETAARATFGQVLNHRLRGAVTERKGNADAHNVPQGVYATDEGSWIALTVSGSREWNALAEVLERADWLCEEWSALDHRQEHHAQIEEAIVVWAAARSASDVVATLTAAGVPVAEVLGAGRVPDHPQFAARGFFEKVNHPVAGSHPVPGMPFRSAVRAVPWHESPAPVLGEHTDEVLQEWLGLEDRELAALRHSGATSDVPTAITGDPS